jgi:excisionase family DNA binding protein
MEQYLFSLSEPPAGVDGVSPVRPNVWLLTPDEIPPILFTPEEVGRLLGVGRPKVYELIRLREIRSVKVGCSRRVSAFALREYVDSLEARVAS